MDSTRENFLECGVSEVGGIDGVREEKIIFYAVSVTMRRGRKIN